jgi:hypothetical protein
MRAAVITISVCAALFFATSIGLTFFAHGYIKGLAQGYAVERSRPIADRAVETAEQALQEPILKPLLNDDVVATVRQEIADYRRDSHAYITRLVTGERQPAPIAVPVRLAPLREHVLRWKDGVRKYFDRTIDGLVRDLRIFSGSNLAAALLAAYFALRARGRQLKRLLSIAGLLLVSMAYGVYMYIDEFSYFRILFNLYVGWWYPVLLVVLFAALYRDFGLHKPVPPEATPPEATPQHRPPQSTETASAAG